MLTIVGGTYIEYCQEPEEEELWGSGLRAAAALSDKDFDVEFKSCIGKEELGNAKFICNTFNIKYEFQLIAETVTWEYYHPLSKPRAYSSFLKEPRIHIHIEAETVLYYGMAEADIKVNADYLVYDPQNGVPYMQTESVAKHLALVLNKKEAISLAGLDEKEEDLLKIGRILLTETNADVIVIKNGASGGLVIEPSDSSTFPVYFANTVWPIGSGDIFSAAFAWKWAIEKQSPVEAAKLASQYTASYCATRVLPLSKALSFNECIPIKEKKTKIYLAGPFFTISERWIINELRNTLLEFDNDVFSPLHDVGLIGKGDSITAINEIVSKDLSGLEKSDVVLAVADNSDLGTIFEIGYAVANKKRIVILAENLNPNSLTMLEGSDCILVRDLPTAVYRASW